MLLRKRVRVQSSRYVQRVISRYSAADATGISKTTQREQESENRIEAGD